jgi:hypothetical protein
MDPGVQLFLTGILAARIISIWFKQKAVTIRISDGKHDQVNPADAPIYKYSQLLFSMVRFTIVNWTRTKVAEWPRG